MSETSVLFILKRKELPYDDDSPVSVGDCQPEHGLETGLFNSAKFVSDMLNGNGIVSNIVVVHDNNDIDREVTKHRPSVCIIEALWVVPEKFDILQKLHPNVKWVVRLHSALSFISNEGNAMNWVLQYLQHSNVFISCNDLRILDSIRALASVKFHWGSVQLKNKVLYQPNFYPDAFEPVRPINKSTPRLDIGCFGAIRPLKNQLAQAVAAVQFAEAKGYGLNFHINGNRVEMKGAPVLHNLIGLFDHLPHASLVLHDWQPHGDFRRLVGTMDMGLQVSYSETFNIVAADFVAEGVPLVTSDEIFWTTATAYADPNRVDSIVSKMNLVFTFPAANVIRNQKKLRDFDSQSVEHWKTSLALLRRSS